MAQFFHRVSRTAALLALAEIRFGHLHDDELAAALTAEIQTRDAPLQEVLVSPRYPRGESEAELHRVVATVMRRLPPYSPS